MALPQCLCVSGFLCAKFKEFILFYANPKSNVLLRLLGYLLMEINSFCFSTKIEKRFLKPLSKYSLLIFENIICV